MLKDTYVSYGLGNFLWYGTSPYQDSDDSGAVTLTVAHGRVRSAVFTPALIDGRGVPVPQRGATKARINERSAALRSCSGLAAAPTGTG
jgi:poly-gamma-glutamate synthesis protein (capsule biosynthesis protein)